MLAASEAVRQPQTLLLTLVLTVGCFVTPLVFMHNFGEEGQMARNTGLALHFFLGMFTAVTAAAGALSREMQSGTAATVLSKPVSRDTVFLAKFIGVAAMVIIFSVTACGSTLISHRIAERFFDRRDLFGYFKDVHMAVIALAAVLCAMIIAGIINYRTRKPFASRAFLLILAALLIAIAASGFLDEVGRFKPYALRMDPAIAGVSLLLTMALLIITAIALSLSTRFTPATTLAICSALFLAGLGSDYFFGSHPGIVFKIAYVVFPNWQHFWLADALNNGGRIPLLYLLHAAAYTFCYTVAVLAAGVWSFRRVDVQ